MKLEPREILLKEIMIDPFNPRFTITKTLDQQTLINEMLQSKESKELLNSMKEDIKWVNRIVLQEISTHEKYDKFGNLKDNYNYIVVEGNTRISCLKSGLINDYSENTIIPVLLASKEDSEDIDSFRKQIRITQGIANVTVVKEWSQVAKAKHLNSLYNDIIEDKRPQDVYKQISTELGINLKEVRELIIRYKIFSKIAEISDPIADENWGYLEAFDKNNLIRKLIGMSSETMEFVQNDEEYFDEILSDIPNLIKHALNQGLNSKNFRDIIIEISKNNSTSEEFNNIIIDILDENTETSFVSIKNNMKIKSDKENWEADLNNIFDKISNFPSLSDWALDLNHILIKIDDKLKKHIGIINSDE
ncbi:hypothetical protein AR438_13145 [Chryseobacterium aquaticum]|uniref:ParB/Sulfiredoxin domain-containing protein n=1 Tax=Chryseobacterium aquaticum TaxID=452084 RepID=A0A0Q3SIQ6_9FLAO|nr:hypothetical protein [Chryseobacterium aquaticum]KQK25074.1 hypothetical protein AR438_13145 [Chryseobacterium aquaticum]